MEENQPQKVEETTPVQELKISDEIKSFLVETAKWGKFLSIIGFCFCGLIAIIAVAVMFLGSKLLSSLGAGIGGAEGGFIGAIYLAMGLIYYFPSKYLYDFSVFTKQALEINDQESLTYAFERLKSLYRFWGVLVVAFLAFYAIIILVTVASLVFSAR